MQNKPNLLASCFSLLCALLSCVNSQADGFNPGMVAHSQINLSGNGITVDSFEPGEAPAARTRTMRNFANDASNLIVNGSFELGLTGWTVNTPWIMVNPYPAAASDGTNFVALGAGNLSGAILSQTIPTVGGAPYNLLFDLMAVGDPGRTGIVRVEIVAAIGIVAQQTFTNSARNTPPFIYQPKTISFAVHQTTTSVTLRFIDLSPNSGIAVDPILDNVRIVPPPPPIVIAGPITNPANGHLYYFLSQHNWTASQAAAVALGGNLVTINNLAEHNWVYTNFSTFGGIPRSLWIGLSDLAQEGNFVWANGEISPYRNWAPVEPNSYDAFEDFVHIFAPNDPFGRAGRWNDVHNLTSIYADVPAWTVPLHGVVEVDTPPPPTNRAPIAVSQSVSLNEDIATPLTLIASDADGDTLIYSVTQPSNGTLSGTAPNLIYIPNANFHGSDSFTFKVNDGQLNSTVATISITVVSVNDAPIAVATASSSYLFSPNEISTVVIAPCDGNAIVTLDASLSSDIENDPLQFLWTEGTNVLGTSQIISNSFAVGTHSILLTVNDGSDSGFTTLIVEVITPAESVAELILFVEDSNLPNKRKQPLIASLNAAVASFARCHIIPGVNQLEAFQNKVYAQIAPLDAALAEELLHISNEIIGAVNSNSELPIKPEKSPKTRVDLR